MAGSDVGRGRTRVAAGPGAPCGTVPCDLGLNPARQRHDGSPEEAQGNPPPPIPA